MWSVHSKQASQAQRGPVVYVPNSNGRHAYRTYHKRYFAVGADYAVLHDTRLLLLLPRAGQCVPAAGLRSWAPWLGSAAGGHGRRGIFPVIRHRLHGDPHNCALSVLQA